ncbi:MAG: TRAM domain-containing protein [Coriobacteriia bacterium]
MIVHITRFVFVTAGVLGGYAISGLIDWPETTGYPDYFVIFIFLILGTSMGYLLGGILGREFAIAYRGVEERLSDLSPSEIALGTVGLIVGLVIAWLVSLPLRLVEPTWVAVLSTALLFLLAGYFGLRVALLKRTEVIRAFPGVAGPQTIVEPARLRILDTSAVIDGRFLQLLGLGALDGEFRVPGFVIAELHTLADSPDDIKRSRGRRGLDLLSTSTGTGGIQTFDADYPEIKTVDDKLLRLASDSGAAIVTVDFNLTKVARVRGLDALNINEVAAALKPAHLPGEPLRVRITREGKEAGQGVGYLEDGTMVVVSDGGECVGRDVDTEVTSVLQTSAGRMVFARFVSSAAAQVDDGPGNAE